MSHLKVFRPADADFEHRIFTDESDEPVILAFKPRTKSRHRGSVMDMVTRARVLSENCRCPDCGHAIVEPVDLGDARLDRACLPIPCSSTLVGFYCHRCELEWAV